MDLTDKLNAVLARRAAIEAEVAAVAFQAHSIGGGALERLDELNAEDLKLSREAGSLNVAVEIGERNVTAETERSVDAVELGQAREALAMVDVFASRGQDLDLKVRALVDGYT
jgi:hypothetical protein